MKVSMIAAMTFCGRISPGPLASQMDRCLLEKMRYETGASLLGAETLRSADPEMSGPDGVDPSRFRGIMTLSGRIPVTGKKIFQGENKPIIFTGSKEFIKLRQSLEGLAHVVELAPGQAGLSIGAALDFFAGKGVDSVLIEGGGKLNYAALLEGVVDELIITIVPKLSGDRLASLLVDGESPLGSPFLNLELISCEAAPNGEIFTRYRVPKGNRQNA